MSHFVSFRLLAEIFWKVYRNCFLQALRIVLTEEMFFRTKKCFSKNFGVRAKKILDLRQKKATQPNFCSSSPVEHLEENNVVKRNSFLSFSDSERKTLGSCPKNFWLRSLNCILKIQKVIFRHISWCSMTHFVSFRLLAKIIWRV